MSAHTTVDISKLLKRFSQSKLVEKQKVFAKRVAFEIRDYVPEDEGTLKNSEPLNSVYETGHLEWNTPYAGIVHELPQSSISTRVNPNAKAKWTEVAKQERLDDWKEFARKLVEGS